MKSFIKKTFILVCLVLLLPFSALAHPGRTDYKGCHTCRTNCTEKWGLDYGEYHCHAKKIKKARRESRRNGR